jgi:hypothetical protein
LLKTYLLLNSHRDFFLQQKQCDVIEEKTEVAHTGAQGPLDFMAENVCPKNKKGAGRLETMGVFGSPG